MPTGACGINCDICKLKLLGVCSSCGPGRSREAEAKLAAQMRLFGWTCPVLECARMNNLDYCIRDCLSFPCNNFTAGPYPFSEGFLHMQERRRKGRPPALDHNGLPISVPDEYWEALTDRDRNAIANLTLFEPHPSGGLLFPFLSQQVLVDIANRRLLGLDAAGGGAVLVDPLLELVTLIYLNHVKAVYPLGKDIISCKDLKEAHYFKGRHQLRLYPIVELYGEDHGRFKDAALHLRGTPLDMADTAFRLLPFPRVPLYYLLWKGDEEFQPRVSVLFDRSIETVFHSAAIWSLVNLVSFFLLKGPERHL